MPRPSSSETLTALLIEAGKGDRDAREQLWQRVYPDLKQIAHRELRRRRPGQTLHTTALVHEAYLKLIEKNRVDWESRLQFYALAGRAMRHILVDYARRNRRAKRSGKKHEVSLDEAAIVADERAETFLVLDESLTRLSELNERLGWVVECRFFGGMTQKEIAQLFNVSERTVERDWFKAKAWLASDLAAAT